MSRATPVTRLLETFGVPYRLHIYAFDADADSSGLQAATALGIAPPRMLKNPAA